MKRLLLIALVSACDSSAALPVPAETPIVALSAHDRHEVCEYFVDELGDERRIDCGDGTAVEVGADGDDVDDCEDQLGELAEDENCALTVADYDACIAALTSETTEQACTHEEPAACDALDRCETD